MAINTHTAAAAGWLWPSLADSCCKRVPGGGTGHTRMWLLCSRTCANFCHLVSGLGLGMGFSRGRAVLGAGRYASLPPCTASLGSANSWLTRAWVMPVASSRHLALRLSGVKSAASSGLGSNADRLPRSNSRWLFALFLCVWKRTVAGRWGELLGVQPTQAAAAVRRVRRTLA